MDKKLIPAHVLFARWFIRIRWIATAVLVISTYIVKHLFKISIHEIPLYSLSVALGALNIIHTILLKLIKLKEDASVIKWIKREIHFQIVADLIVLTFILHFSGGIENPIIIFYFFHMIVASSIFSTLQSYLHTTFAMIMLALLSFLECYGIIPHYHLEGFVNHDLYQNEFYIYVAGIIFIFTSVLLVSLTHFIISRSIKVEEAYVKTNLELEKKDKLQNEYVLHVTHDIKGHLAAILSCLKVIKTGTAGGLNETQKELTDRAYERTDLLVSFVKDLLNLTSKRLKREPEFENFSLVELISRVISSFQVLARDKSIEFNYYLDPDVGTITGNPYTLEELYSNLLSNAIKYTSENGHIDLIVRNRKDDIETEISDSGIGIPKNEVSKVFDEFYRASNVPKDIRTGSGLGLSIVKQIIETHKGRIWISSEPGIWTKIVFLLPKDPATRNSEMDIYI